jgi:glycosyltransferase involved in cell wall biosynthesis
MTHVPPLRVACYGYAELAAGSVASAGHVVLTRLLQRGHLIDFFGKRSFAYPVGLEDFPNFRYVDVEGRAERVLVGGAGRGPRPWREVMARLAARETERNIPAAMVVEQSAGRRYDLQLYLGTWAFGRLPGVPSVSWVQGPPGTDGRSIARHAADIRRLDGAARYAMLRSYAIYRDTFGRPPFGNADRYICGSRWSADAIRPLVPSTAAIDTLPYPIDLAMFRPDPALTRPDRAEVLWLGRSVPRKRLDLFLGACERLIETGRDITVRVVGGFGMVPGYRQLLSNFRHPDRLVACDGVPRTDVPALLRRATVLVQPSEEENFGSSVAEAMACGTPVVVGPTNGTGDYVGDAGVRFDRYDSAAVAAAVNTVLDGVAADPSGWCGRCRAAAELAFDVERVVDRLEMILRWATSCGLSPIGGPT